LDVLKYEGTVFETFVNIVDNDTGRLLNWMTMRSVKVRKMHINGDGAIDETMAASFWKNQGSEFQYLSIQRLTPEQCSILQQATALRKMLRRLQVETCKLPYSLAVAPYLEACGASLEVLDLSFQDSLPLVLGTATFPSLHTLGLTYASWLVVGPLQSLRWTSSAGAPTWFASAEMMKQNAAATWAH
jgi:hypothetical protein